MSIDKSLKGASSLRRHRNVLTRAERIETLKELGRWTDDSSPFGLPKIENRKAKVAKKEKEAKTDDATESTETTDAKDKPKE